MDEQGDIGIDSLLDMGLEGLDFETAYEIINERAELWDEPHEQLNMNLVEDGPFYNSTADQEPSTYVEEPGSRGVDEVEEAKRLKMKGMVSESSSSSHYGEHMVRPQTPRESGLALFSGNGSSSNNNNSHSEGLLSVNESHAIEHFLDSFLTASPSKAAVLPFFSPKTVSSLLKSNNDVTTGSSTDSGSYFFDSQSIQSTIDRHFSEKVPSKKEDEEQPSDTSKVRSLTNESNSESDFDSGAAMELPSISSLERYEPIDPQIPAVEVPDYVIPPELSDNAAELRRWKHVYAEKQRRYTFKREYDALVGLIRYPRPDWSEIHKMLPKAKDVISLDYKLPKKEGKRVSKHTLLNYIIQDIQLLLLANEELEQMFD
ncbi:BHLH domain-containing protein [Kluyveromyces marxianus]